MQRLLWENVLVGELGMLNADIVVDGDGHCVYVLGLGETGNDIYLNAVKKDDAGLNELEEVEFR